MGYKYGDLALQVGGLDARLTSLFCKKKRLAKSEQVKARPNPAEFSMEGYGSKGGCFAIDDEMLFLTFLYSSPKDKKKRF
jgi:hypothetical protein